MYYYKKTNKKVFLLGVLVAVILGFIYPNHSAAVSSLTIDPDAVTDFKINSSIMEVNLIKSYMIVGERKINVCEFKLGNKIYKTSLLDKQGKIVKLNSFTKGQRVVVKGFELPEGVIMAEIIQKVPE